MNIIQSNIVIGLEWTLYESLAQAKAAVSGKKDILVARKSVSGECVQGVCPADKKQKNGLLAGALLAAECESNALIYHEINKDSIWICVIRDGIPLHGYDAVLPLHDAQAMVAEAISYAPNAKIYGDLDGAVGTIEDLFSQANSKAKKAARLQGQKSQIILVVIAIIFMGGAFVAFNKIQQTGNQNDANLNNNMLAALSQQSFAEQQERKQALEREFNQNILTAKNEFWMSKKPGDQLAVWYGVVRSTPHSVQGWNFSAIKCSTSACELTWSRSEKAMPSAFTSLPGALVSADQQKAVTSVEIEKLKPIVRDKITGVTLYLQDIGVTQPGFSSTPALPISITPPGGLQTPSVTIGKEGGWQITLANLVMLNSFLKHLDLAGIEADEMLISEPYIFPSSITIKGRYRDSE